MATNTIQEPAPKMTKETGQFNNNWRKAAYYMECLTKVAQSSNGFPYKDIWHSVLDDMTWEQREAFIKDKKKREVKKADKFVATGIEKPKNTRNLFLAEYRADCSAKGIDYNNDAFEAAYKALGEADKARLKAIYDADAATYKRKVAEQQKSAIDNGEFPEPKPKGKLTEYLLFCSECRKPDNKFLTAEQKAEFAAMTADIKGQSGFISKIYAAVKATPAMDYIKAMVSADKVRYETELHAWKIRALERALAKATRDGAETASIATELETLRSTASHVSKASAASSSTVSTPAVSVVEAAVTEATPTKKPRAAPRGKSATATKQTPVPEPEDA